MATKNDKSHSTTSMEICPKENEKPQKAADIVIPKLDHWLAMLTFTMLGNTQLLIWDFVINEFNSMQSYIWPGEVFSDLLGGFEHGTALLVCIVMLKFNSLNVKWTHFFGIFNVFLYLIFPLIPQLFVAESELDANGAYQAVNGNNHLVISKILLSVICCFLGICVGFMHVYGYAFASVLPKNYVAYVSTGNGVAGVISFLLYTLLFSIFPRTPLGQVQLTWVFFALGAVVSTVQVVCFWMLSKKTWFKQCVELAKANRTDDTEKSLQEWGERRTFWPIFKDCFTQTANVSVTAFVTCFLYPMSGPFQWGKNPDITNALNGTFQIVDLLTRWMPVLGGWTLIPKKWLTPLTWLRFFILIPLFVIPGRLQGLTFLGDTWWLFVIMIIFTITNGWFVTVGSVYCPECVEHPAEKEIVANIFVIGLLTFVTLGVVLSKLPYV